MKLSRRWKSVIVISIVASLVLVIFSSHYVQLGLAEHISLKEFIVRMIVANQDLNASSPMYGSFFNASRSTVQAIDVLDTLGGLSRIDDNALMRFLIGPNQTGPLDSPMKYVAQYNVESAFVIAHTAWVLGKLNELPIPLRDSIRETIRAYQNTTSISSGFWWIYRSGLFETARLLNENQFVNVTMQKQDILNDLDMHVWQTARGIHDIFLDIRSLEEIDLIQGGMGFVRYSMPDTARNMVEFYVLSLWDDVRYGFYESFEYYDPLYYEPSMWATSSAIYVYARIEGFLGFTDRRVLREIVGYDYEKVLNFLKKCQNRYGIFFGQPSDVDDQVTSLQIWLTYYAVVLLKAISRLDYLDQIVRWPAQPTFIESVGDLFRK